jgi:hypothetical protein
MSHSHKYQKKRKAKVQRTVLPIPEEDPLKGCLQAFDVNYAIHIVDEKSMHLIIGDPQYPKWQGKFKFEIACRPTSTSVFVGHRTHSATTLYFSLSSKTCLIVIDQSSVKKCAITSFWLDNNVPTLASRWLEKQDEIVGSIADDFKDQYASLLLDNMINS